MKPDDRKWWIKRLRKQFRDEAKMHEEAIKKAGH